MTTKLPDSYSTNRVYDTVPEFIRNKDAENGYTLWWYLYGSCKALDRIDVLTRYNVGPGVHLEPNIDEYATVSLSDSKLAFAISPSDTTITIFGTDATWNNIDPTKPFSAEIVDTLNDVKEVIRIPAGHYDWTAPFVAISGITRGYHNTTPSYFKASAGADGSIYTEDYLDAPGWSQVVDIDRCPDYALPWLAQFVGAAVPVDNNLNRQQIVQQIEQRAGFNRATTDAIVAELVAITNKQLSPAIAPLSQQQIIVMENTQFQNSGGKNYFTYNQYALTLLIPTRVFSSYTYSSLKDASGGTIATYTSTDSFITSIGGLYFSLAGSTTPSSSSPYVNFVYRYRPAGLQIFVGGY
jgi:hypothetical protein